VAFQVGLLGRQVEPPAVQLAQLLAVALGHHLLGGRINECAGIAGREHVHARVVGEEQFGGVETGCGGERPPGCRPRVRGVAGMAGDGEMPAGCSAHGAEDEHPLELAERNRLAGGPVGQRPVRDLAAQRKPPRTAPEQRLHQRKFREFPQRADLGTDLLNAHLAPL
jgi:hypothetical protein